jgi:hypothetical protein
MMHVGGLVGRLYPGLFACLVGGLVCGVGDILVDQLVGGLVGVFISPISRLD